MEPQTSVEEEPREKRRRVIGVGGEDTSALGALEGEVLRLLWDAGEPQSFVQLYEAMHLTRRGIKREMQSPSTIAVALGRMTEKGLLTVERRPQSSRGLYRPTSTRAEVVATLMDDVTRRLAGQPLRSILTLLTEENAIATPENAASIAIVKELQRHRKQSKPSGRGKSKA